MQSETEPIERMLTPQEVADALHVSLNTLRAWRVRRRKGHNTVPLKFTRPGGRILYRAADVRSFLESVTFTPGEPKGKRSQKVS